MNKEEMKKELFKEWIKAKSAENKAKKAREVIEEKLIPLFPFDDTQSKTFNEDNFKITLKKSTTYSLDQEKWKTIRLELLEEERPEKIKFEIDKEGYEWMRKNRPAQFDLIKKCVTIKDGKTSVTVEKI